MDGVPIDEEAARHALAFRNAHPINESVVPGNGIGVVHVDAVAKPEEFVCQPSQYEQQLRAKAARARAEVNAYREQRLQGLSPSQRQAAELAFPGPSTDADVARLSTGSSSSSPVSSANRFSQEESTHMFFLDGISENMVQRDVLAQRDHTNIDDELTSLCALKHKIQPGVDADTFEMRKAAIMKPSMVADGLIGAVMERMGSGGRLSFPRRGAPSRPSAPTRGSSSTEEEGNQGVRGRRGRKPGDADNQGRTCVNDPVDVTRGEYVDEWNDFQLDGTIPIRLARSYASLQRIDGPFGNNRTCFLDTIIRVSPDNRLVYRNQHSRLVWFERPFSLTPSTNSRHRHLRLTAPWLKQLELQDRKLTHKFEQGKDKVYRLTSIVDRNGNSFSIVRDADGLVVEAEHSDGYTLKFENDAQGLRRAVTRIAPGAPNILLASYTYDHNRNLLSAECTTSNSVFYSYDDQGRLSGWRDRGPTRTAIVYDTNNRVARIATSGRFNGGALEYDSDVRATTYRPGGQAFQRYVYDREENVLEETNALGEVKRFSYEDGYRTSETDGEGNTTAFSFDNFGNIASVRDACGRTTLYRWGSRGELDLVIDPEGNTHSYDHDERGNPIAWRSPAAALTRFRWTAAGRLAGTTYPDGAEERFIYDAAHRLSEHHAADGGVTRYQRDTIGRITAIKDPIGAVTQFAYEANNGPAFWLPTRIVRADGTILRRSYDGEGLVTSVTDGEERTTTYRYGPFDELRAIIDPKGGMLQFTYDVTGELVSVTNPMGQRYTYERDTAGRIVSETDYDGRQLRYTRDKAGRLTSRTAPDGSCLQYAYDPSGRLTRIDAFEPDSAGRTSDVPTTTEHFTYDARGLLVRAENSAAVATFERDAMGRVAAESQNGRRVSSVFDARGRRTQRGIGFAAGWSAEGQAHVGFQGLKPEDINAGRILTASRSIPSGVPATDGLTHYAYDRTGRLTELRLGVDADGTPGEVLAFTRDLSGRETMRSNGQGFSLEQNFDALGRLIRQTVSGQLPQTSPGRATASKDYRRAFTYDRSNAPTVVSDNLWGASRYVYDANGQVTNATHGVTESNGGPGNPPSAWLNPVKPGGTLGLGDDTMEVERFSYNPAKDIAESDTALPGEPIGRAMTPWLSSVGGRVHAARGPGGERVMMTFDVNGRVVERRVERDGFRPKVWTYRWDAFDRLVACVTPQGVSWQFEYDPLGRRIGKRQVGKGQVGDGDQRRSGQAAVRFTWDGDTVAEEIRCGPGRDLDIATRVQWHFAPDTFVPLAREAASKGTCHVVADHLGTPRELVSSTGDVAWATTLRLWGGIRRVSQRSSESEKRVASTPALNLALPDENEQDLPCPIRFQGQWEDPETGLYYNRHRYYDPLVGQYLSPDPIGLEGGTRPQAYVPNPLLWIDPLGLACCLTLGSRSEALNEAKRQNGIPTSASPDAEYGPGQMGLDNRNVRMYEYTNSQGSQIWIREDLPASYGAPGGVGDQGPHFNAGPAGGDLGNQHYYFPGR